MLKGRNRLSKVSAAALLTFACTLSASAQPGKNVDFTLYETNPTLFLLLIVAGVAAVLIVALLLMRSRKKRPEAKP